MPTMAHQYTDLPLVPQSFDEHHYEHHCTSWGQEDVNHMSSYRFQHGDGSYEENASYGDCYDNGMVMDRFMQDPYPHAQGFLHVKVPVQRSLDQHFDIQWPVPDYNRHISPSPSGNSSGPTTSEHCSPQAYYPMQYGSPEELNSFSYTALEQFHDGRYSSQTQLLGGCSLKQLEYTQLEPERVVEDHDDVNMQEDAPCDHEPVVATKVEAEPEAMLGYADSGIGNSVRDAESVQRALTEQDDEPTSDSDYSPSSSGSGKRKRSTSNGVSKPNKRRGSTRNNSIASSTASPGKAMRKPRASVSSPKNHANTHDSKRYFPCPFAVYGCSSTFSSKNEWKRHVSTQHMKLTFYRCDLCPPTADNNDEHTVWYNDFNRKDLFAQHLRRMHAAPKEVKSRSPKLYPVDDENIGEVQTRCLQQLRKAPRHSICLFCDKTFDGNNSWDERMEHVGRHLEKDRNSIPDMLDIGTWRLDADLEQYLLEENLIVREGGQWRISDGKKVQHSIDTSDSEEE